MYRNLPRSLGTFDVEASEMCFVQYLPIVMPGRFGVHIPPHLLWTRNLVSMVLDQCFWEGRYIYAYLTAKHLWVTPDNIGNRPGWHIDGYLSDDLNIIWSDKYPTEFCVQDFNLSPYHNSSLVEMQQQAKECNIVTLPEKSVVVLDQSNVHRPPVIKEEGWRTFVKISLSNEKYNLKGNAHNYLFDYNWGLVERQVLRNHPSK